METALGWEGRDYFREKEEMRQGLEFVSTRSIRWRFMYLLSAVVRQHALSWLPP